MLGITKIVINEQEVAVRTCKKVKYTPSKLYENKARAHQRHHHMVHRDYFWLRYSDTPVCMGFLDEIRRQQVIDQKIYDQRLMDDTVRQLAWDELQKNIVMGGDTMIDKETGEMLGPKVDSMYWKTKLKLIL